MRFPLIFTQRPSVKLYFPDPYYDSAEFDDDTGRYGRDLNKKFGIRVKEANIGNTADIPAWVLSLPIKEVGLSAAAVAVFFSGESIKKNLDAWTSLAQRLSRFFAASPALDRNAAASLAILEICQKKPDRPRNISLIEYRVGSKYFGDFSDARRCDDEIKPFELGGITHYFELDVDGERMLAAVNGVDVAVNVLDSTSPRER